MAENKMKQVAKLLGVKMEESFKVKNDKGNILTYSPYTLRYDGVYDKDNELRAGILTWLLNGIYEIERPILDDVEKRYLEGVLRPFKDRVMSIKKSQDVCGQRIFIELKEDCFGLPYFEKNTMYKGMELNRRYTPQELGLFNGGSANNYR